MGSSRRNKDQKRSYRTDSPLHTKYSKTVNGLGAFEIILGFISCALGLAIIILLLIHCKTCGYFEKLGAGIWGGIFLIACGIVGTKKRSHSSKCVLNSNIGLSIVAAAVMCAVFTLSFLSPGGEGRPASVAYLHLTLCGVSALGFVLCFVHSVFCCMATCRPRPVVAVIYENPRTGEQQILYEDTKQGAFLPAPPPQHSRSLPLISTPQPIRGALPVRPYDTIPSAPLEPPPHPEPEVKRKPHPYKGQVLETTERNYMGVVSQIAHKQMGGHYDNVEPSEIQGAVHHRQVVRELSQRHRWQDEPYIRHGQHRNDYDHRGQGSRTPHIGSPSQGHSYLRY